MPRFGLERGGALLRSPIGLIELEPAQSGIEPKFACDKDLVTVSITRGAPLAADHAFANQPRTAAPGMPTPTVERRVRQRDNNGRGMLRNMRRLERKAAL